MNVFQAKRTPRVLARGDTTCTDAPFIAKAERNVFQGERERKDPNSHRP
jgi:hypothetical protein